MQLSALTPESAEEVVATVEDAGISYALFLPNADRDHIQKLIRGSGAPYERDMLRDMASRLSPGALVVDAGANIGNHTEDRKSVV